MVVAGSISGGLTIASGIFGSRSAKKARRRAEKEARARAAELASLERSRQAIINPYEGVKDVSSLASDLTGMVSNPYASLGVATKAAEFQAEQADISLANTLDTLQQTGAGAGGATALAQAALQSKKEISANIEQQEAANQKLRAQGESEMQQIKMNEAQRIQEVKMSEAQRVQNAEVAGKQFMFNVREEREVAKMNRVAGQMDNAQAQAAKARADQTGAITGMLGGLSSIASSMGKGGAFDKAPSDRRLKTDIKNIGVSTSGLNIYSFKYKDDKFGSGVWQGVMADEVPSFAVSKNSDGYSQVDYSLIDVEFKQI
jgi:predicted lipoprotein with Yx(FWY)xxD motif